MFKSNVWRDGYVDGLEGKESQVDLYMDETRKAQYLAGYEQGSRDRAEKKE